MQPKVSIIIPVYNVEKYLTLCLNSVTNQTLTDIEIICVEDGSTDNSKKILAEYEKSDSRIRVIWHSNNMGTGMARKHGVLAAHGQYIMFLDSDDELFPQACEVAYAAIVKNKTDVVQFGVKVVNKEGKTIRFEHLCTDECDRLEDYNLLCLHQKGKLKSWEITNKIYYAGLCRKACGEMTAEHLIMAEDVYLFCILGYYARSIFRIQDELYVYHWGNGLWSGIKKGISLEHYIKLLCEKDALDAITLFFDTKPDKGNYQIFMQYIYDNFLHQTITWWCHNLAEEHKKQGFMLFVRKWGEKATAEAMIWLVEDLQARNEKCMYLQNSVEDLRNELSATKRNAEEAKLNLKAIQAGWSFRIGRAITYIPRKLLGRP